MKLFLLNINILKFKFVLILNNFINNNFRYCKEIGDAGVKYLSQAFEKWNLMTNFNLNLL